MPSTPSAWTPTQIGQHQEAARRLIASKDEALTFLAEQPHTSEYELQQFLNQSFRVHGLRRAHGSDQLIVAFRQSTDAPHYFPSKQSPKYLQPNSLIMLDIWGALANASTAPFADITWMAYYGSTVPAEIQKAYDAVIQARDACLEHIGQKLQHKTLPIGREANAAANAILIQHGYEENIKHSTGHSLGTISPHGRLGHIRRTNARPLQTNLGYTIEPGVYIEKQFGIRSEINFYITDRYELQITTDLQRDLIILTP